MRYEYKTKGQPISELVEDPQITAELEVSETEGERSQSRSNGDEPAMKRASRGASFGLFGMQERIRLVGGEVEINSKPNHGTTILACFPLASPFSNGKCAQGIS